MKPISVILLLALALSGCSGFSREARQQHAYEKYVRKSMAQRSKQQKRISKHEAQIPDSEMSPERVNVTLDRSGEADQ